MARRPNSTNLSSAAGDSTILSQWKEIKRLESMDGATVPTRGASFSFALPTSGKGAGVQVDTSSVDEPWKHDAYYYYKTTAEVRKVVDITARGVSACELEVGRMSSKGTFIHMPNDPELSNLLMSLDGPSGNYNQIMESIATSMQIVGDGYFIGNPVRENGQIISYEDWEFVSIKELSISGTHDSRKIQRNASGGVIKHNFHSSADLTSQELPEDYYVARCWRRSAEYSQLSTSALQANLRTLKLLSKLDDLINAIANSQIMAGVFIVPEEASFGPEDDTIDGGEAAEDQLDPLTQELLDIMAEAVEDRSSAASLTPILLRIKHAYADQVRLVRLARDLDTQTSIIREELYRRLAIGLDAPPETIDGKSGLNNWTGYQVDAEFATKHIIPLGHLISDFLTRSYLWPMLRMRIRDGLSTKRVEDVKKYRIAFNPRNIVARIDKATLATKLFERGILSAEATVRACGFEPSDMPTADERRQALIIDLFKASPVTLAPVLLPLIDGLEHLVDQIPSLSGEMPSGSANEDGDARGDGPRRTREDGGPGTSPDPDRINDDRGPGGDREDSRVSPDSKADQDLRSEETQQFLEELNSLGRFTGNEDYIKQITEMYAMSLGLDHFESGQLFDSIIEGLSATKEFDTKLVLRSSLENLL